MAWIFFLYFLLFSIHFLFVFSFTFNDFFFFFRNIENNILEGTNKLIASTTINELIRIGKRNSFNVILHICICVLQYHSFRSFSNRLLDIIFPFDRTCTCYRTDHVSIKSFSFSFFFIVNNYWRKEKDCFRFIRITNF